jgi:hypothetical protein
MPEFIKPFGKIPATVAPFVKNDLAGSVDVTSVADCDFKQAVVELRSSVDIPARPFLMNRYSGSAGLAAR